MHILAWGIFMAMLVYLVPKPGYVNSFIFLFIPNLLFIIFFYLNYYFLVPRFFLRRKYLIYWSICLISLAVSTGLPSLFFSSAPPQTQPQFHVIPPNAPPEFSGSDFGDSRPAEQHSGSTHIVSPDFSYAFFVFALVLLLSLGLRIAQQWQQAEKEKVNAELAFLKAQINPHFLFNTLNNIHSMVINNSEKTSEAIEVFSDLMRFVIFETRNETVPLIDKLQYIRNYLTLQRMRLPENVEVNFVVEGNPHPYQIAPMILMPFIENAFKYGVSTEKKSVISIWIEIKNHELLFCVINQKFNRKNMTKELSQLGIGNTKKRLNLIYPGRHKLNISETENEYQVSLQINLK
jgi:hypothetical protein